MSNKLVSVVIPTYNRAYCIEKSIRSVLDQSYKNIEVIIIDDCSKDNTEEVIKNIADNRIKYIKNRQNLGAAGSRNKGAQLAKGEFLAFNDSDDLWHEKKLQLQMEALQMKNAQMVYCRLKRCIKKDNITEIIPSVSDEKSNLEGNIFSLMLVKNVIALPTVVIRKELFDLRCGFNSKMKVLEDYEFFLRVTRNISTAFLDKVLVDSFDYGDGINDARMNALENIKAIALMANEFEDDLEKCKGSNSFKSNLPFFVQNLEPNDLSKLEPDVLMFVTGELKSCIFSLYNQIDLLNETIQELNEQHWEKDKTIQELNEQHWEKDKTIQELNEQHREKDKTIQELNEQHREKDKTIQQLNEWHWEKDKTIQQLNEWHWEKDRYIKELQERLKGQRNE